MAGIEPCILPNTKCGAPLLVLVLVLVGTSTGVRAGPCAGTGAGVCAGDGVH